MDRIGGMSFHGPIEALPDVIFNSCKHLVLTQALFVIFVAFSTPSPSDDVSRVLEYTIQEELPVGTIVGNVKNDSRLTSKYASDVSLLLRFNFRSANVQHERLFSLNDRTGELQSLQTIDREVICKSTDLTCDISLDVAVKPLQYFQIIKLVIHVTDINDNSPRFPESRISVNIVETTQPGTLFLLPSADDADSGLLGVQVGHIDSPETL